MAFDWRLLLLPLVLGAAAPPRGSAELPRIRPLPREEAGKLVMFASPPPEVARWGRSWLHLERRVVLPRGTRLAAAVTGAGYTPVFLRLTNGRCFALNLGYDGPNIVPKQVEESDCALPRRIEAAVQRLAPAKPPAPRLRYVGRAWNLHGWFDPGKRRSLVASEDGARGLLTANLKLLAMGGIGSPDTPHTLVTLFGRRGGEFVLLTVDLVTP